MGLILFDAGLCLVYAGCTYMDSIFTGIFKKTDTLIYIICFIPSIDGLSMVLDALDLLKPGKEKNIVPK